MIEFNKKIKGFILLDSLYALSIISITIVIGIMVFNSLWKKESIISSYKSSQKMKIGLLEGINDINVTTISEKQFEESDFLLKRTVIMKVNNKEKQLETLIIDTKEN